VRALASNIFGGVADAEIYGPSHAIARVRCDLGCIRSEDKRDDRCAPG